MFKPGDKINSRRLAGEFWASRDKFTGFFVVKVVGGIQLVRFTTWTSDEGTVYPTDTVADASALLPAAAVRRFVTHETLGYRFYGYCPA